LRITIEHVLIPLWDQRRRNRSRQVVRAAAIGIGFPPITESLPLRANIDETLTAAIITEQGGKEKHRERSQDCSSFPHWLTRGRGLGVGDPCAGKIREVAGCLRNFVALILLLLASERGLATATITWGVLVRHRILTVSRLPLWTRPFRRLSAMNVSTSRSSSSVTASPLRPNHCPQF
jgi:hypothetical protein